MASSESGDGIHVNCGDEVDALVDSVGDIGLSDGQNSNEELEICDVWEENLEEEFTQIRAIVQKFQFVALDTSFPGAVVPTIDDDELGPTVDKDYEMMRRNVDRQQTIQVGLTFMDDKGNTPSGCSTWQFNFKFNLRENKYNQGAINVLKDSGIQFEEHELNGIEPNDFAELLMSSGIVLMDDIKWICAHSGYSFGHLLKLLTNQNLPDNEWEFFDALRLYFPIIYDIKHLIKSFTDVNVEEIRDEQELQNQTGANSLLAGKTFFQLREILPYCAPIAPFARLILECERIDMNEFMKHPLVAYEVTNSDNSGNY